ncbi:GNAT family N-acetyltransferase [Lachnospiraceae bacterium 54-53]
MNIIRTEVPGETQKNDMLLLHEACRDHDRISLTLPLEEDCVYYLLYDGDSLLSALCTFFNENGDYECCAYTRPLRRRQGNFTLLLEDLLKETGDRDLVFPVDETCGDTIRTLEAIGASFWYQEHIMELTPAAFLESALIKNRRSRKRLSVTGGPDAKRGISPYIFLENGSPIGSCRVEPGENSVYFYGFEIREELRGKGLGSACLTLFLEKFFRQPADVLSEKLLLQVSGLNLPAMALYEKAGFMIRESLSYYVY